MKPKTLGELNAHLYVTRAATLAYQEMTGAQFETARLALTNHLLDAVPQADGTYLAPVRGDFHRRLRARVVRKGPLMVVTKVEESTATPLREPTQAVYTALPPRNRRRREKR